MSIRFQASSRIAAFVLAPILLVGALPGGASYASGGDAWKVKEKIFGESKKVGSVKDDDDAKKSEDVSGLACAGTGFPRLCLVVDDESQGAQVVILEDGELKVG